MVGGVTASRQRAPNKPPGWEGAAPSLPLQPSSLIFCFFFLFLIKNRGFGLFEGAVRGSGLAAAPFPGARGGAELPAGPAVSHPTAAPLIALILGRSRTPGIAWALWGFLALGRPTWGLLGGAGGHVPALVALPGVAWSVAGASLPNEQFRVSLVLRVQWACGLCPCTSPTGASPNTGLCLGREGGDRGVEETIVPCGLFQTPLLFLCPRFQREPRCSFYCRYK